MTLDEAIAKLEDNSTHALICENGELTAWLRELRECRSKRVKREVLTTKNRDRYIMKVNECDTLCKIQATMLSYNCCVIEALSGKSCPHDKACTFDTSSECIQAWLNAESE